MFNAGSTRAGAGAPPTPTYDFIATPRPVTTGNPMFGAGVVSAAGTATATAGTPRGFGQEYLPGYLPLGQRRSPLVRVVIVLGIVAGAAVALAIAAAVVIPLYVNHRNAEIAAHTSVSLPKTVDGFTKQGGAGNSQVKALAASLPQIGSPQGALYAAGSTRAVTIVGAHPLGSGDQRSFINGVIQGLSGHGLVATKVDPGPLGGSMYCSTAGTKSAKATVCAFADPGAFGVISVSGTGSTAQAMVKALRSGLEHRS
jgi:hypothetical protein